MRHERMRQTGRVACLKVGWPYQDSYSRTRPSGGCRGGLGESLLMQLLMAQAAARPGIRSARSQVIRGDRAHQCFEVVECIPQLSAVMPGATREAHPRRGVSSGRAFA